MKKFYVTLGHLNHLVLAYTEAQAAIVGFKKIVPFMLDEGFEVCIPHEIRVSQRGFDWHDDDFVVDTDVVVGLIHLNNNYSKE